MRPLRWTIPWQKDRSDISFGVRSTALAPFSVSCHGLSPSDFEDLVRRVTNNSTAQIGNQHVYQRADLDLDRAVCYPVVG
jgi:hypothetical protein